MASTIGVTGWFSAKIRTAFCIVSVGTKAELINGKKIIGYENAPAPSGVFAASPAMTATHVKANVNMPSMPNTANHSSGLADERNPISRATPIMTTIDIPFEMMEVKTCPHKTVDLAIGIE